MRAIDADALIDDLKHDVAVDQDSLDYEELTDSNRENIQFDKDCKQNAIDLLQHAPTIEPRCETCEAFNKTRLLIPQPERKKGKWIPVTRIYKVTEGQFPNTHIEWVDTTDPDKIDAVRCSECREVFDFQDARNWCTECGADMREPEDIPMEYFESGGR